MMLTRAIQMIIQRFIENWHGLALGLAFALFTLTPNFSSIEDRYGLYSLFLIKGPEKPPPEIAIIHVSDKTIEDLHLSGDQNQWPRSFYTNLIKKLRHDGAALICFNIFFGTEHPLEDVSFAKLIKESDFVISSDLYVQKALHNGILLENWSKPPQKILNAMLGSAPSILLPGAETEKFITWFGDRREHPSLPLKLLQFYLYKSLSSKVKNPKDLLNSVQYSPKDLLTLDLSERQRLAVLSLNEAHESKLPRYFNHYDLNRVPQISYQKFLMPNAPAFLDVRNKLVIIGFADNFHAENSIETFDSPFATLNSLDLLVTEFATLFEYDKKITRALTRDETLLLIFLWGVLLGSCINAIRFRYFILFNWILALVFATVAGLAFKNQSLIWPVVLPCVMQPAANMLLCIFLFYQKHKKAHHNAKNALDHMLPNHIVKKLIESQKPISIEKTVGACMATDIANYTALAEKLDSETLRRLMDAYFKMIFNCVIKRQGIVSDVIGDATMVYWRDVANPTRRKEVLLAALDIRKAVERFQKEHQIQIPTRIGLHYGELQIGFYGGEEHSAYRAAGDSMNVVSRIEGVNKLLETRILVSTEIMAGLNDFLTRPLGFFQVPGKEKPIQVFELLDIKAQASSELMDMQKRFESALGLCHKGDWNAAFQRFNELMLDFPMDGPIRYFTCMAQQKKAQKADALVSILIEKSPPGRWVDEENN